MKNNMEMEIPKNTVIHCPTEELTHKMLELLSAKGYIIPFSRYIFDIYDQNTCFSYNYRENKGIGFSSLAFYLKKGFKILSAEEFLKQYNMEKKEIKVAVPEGMEVDLEKSIMNEHEVSIVYKAIKKELIYSDIVLGNNNPHHILISSRLFELNDSGSSAKQLEKIFAINQLQNIANYYNEREVDFEKDDLKYQIYYCSSRVEKYNVTTIQKSNYGGILFLNQIDAQSVIDNPNFRKILDKIYK